MRIDRASELIVPFGETDVGIACALAGRAVSCRALLGSPTPEIIYIVLKHATPLCPEPLAYLKIRFRFSNLDHPDHRFWQGIALVSAAGGCAAPR